MSTGSFAGSGFIGAGVMGGESIVFDQGEGCGNEVSIVVGIICHAFISSIHLSIAAILFWTCWRNASRSNSAHLGDAVVR